MDKKFLLIFIFLSSLFVLLAWKFPFKTTSLVSNLEPGPDTFYYSIPAWNFVHGLGFKMEAYGVTKSLVVKPLYGIYLIPFFAIFNDVRAYFFANLILELVSILLLILFVREVFIKSKYREFWMLVVGLVWVTNFYTYNLPSLLMSENLVVPITILFGYLLVRKISYLNIGLMATTIGLFWFSKSSNLPMIGIAGLFLLIKIILNKIYFNISKLALIFLLLVSCFMFLLLAWPYRSYLFNGGDNWASPIYFKQHFVNFLKIFIGGGIRYLWYDNQLIMPVIGYLSVIGLILGLIVKKYRLVSGFVLLSVLANIIFFSFFYSPEGRYLSTIVPLYIVGVVIGFEIIVNKVGSFALILPITLLGIYFLGRTNVNGFYERRLTTLKRQAMNNFIENELPWNYIAIEEYNKFFSKKDDNCYFGSLLNYYYFHLTFNKNCNYLPISQTQDFGDKGMIMDDIRKQNINLVEHYKYLVKSGKNVYVSNYYGSANGSWEADFLNLTTIFEVKKETEGCMGNCSIYKLLKLK